MLIRYGFPEIDNHAQYLYGKIAQWRQKCFRYRLCALRLGQRL